jgi:molecular chaperone GrpE
LKANFIISNREMKEHKKHKAEERENIHKESINEENQPVQEEQNGNAETNQPQEKSETDKIAELNDRYIRLVAEFDNYRRRTAKERMDLVVNAAEETIKGLLPVLDDFERALEMLHKAEGDHSVAIEGTELIYTKLSGYLASKGLKKIEAKGEVLDTDLHEAVAQFPAPDDSMKNRIIEVVQQGYKLNEKIIRFAKVVVGV